MAEETQKMQDTQKEKSFQNQEHVLQTAVKPQESKDVELDDEETEKDRTSRHTHSGGRGNPPRRVIEESVNDPYCE